MSELAFTIQVHSATLLSQTSNHRVLLFKNYIAAVKTTSVVETTYFELVCQRTLIRQNVEER